jgi:U3 small nucleolar RNA-associated protein 21
MTRPLGLRYHRASDLVALSCDDGSIRVTDIDTKKLIRELWASTSNNQLQIVDYTFSNDGRWIIAATSDSVIRVWDLPTGHLIDAMKLSHPCTAIAFSQTGEYLATTQEGDVGVNIWTNRTLFTHVSTRNISDEDIAVVTAPTASGEGGEGIIEAATEQEVDEDIQDETVVPTMDQLTEGITTLSLVPKSRWQTLLHLDIIRSRNKPKEAPKAPEKAPFFLPSLNQNMPSTADSTALMPATQDSSSRITSSALASRSAAATATSEFTRHLEYASKTENYTSMLSYLASLPPSAADIAIRTLDTVPPCTELHTFMKALTARLEERRDYELVQAWMSVFLRLHGDVIVKDEGLIQQLRKWQEEAKRERERVGGLVGYSVGVVGWIRSAR